MIVVIANVRIDRNPQSQEEAQVELTNSLRTNTKTRSGLKKEASGVFSQTVSDGFTSQPFPK